MESDYFREIEAHRNRREAYFATDDHSPIHPDDRGDAFPGLDHYAPDSSYRFELELHRHQEPEVVTVETSTDGVRQYLRWGEFRFSVDGEQVTLQVFKADPQADHLWVPFRDETNGEKTYGAGRYIDLLEDQHRTSDGRWVLDFNLAYNPTCAYNEAYECPLIPIENWLDVPIEAGEKAYPGEPASAHHHVH